MREPLPVDALQHVGSTPRVVVCSSSPSGRFRLRLPYSIQRTGAPATTPSPMMHALIFALLPGAAHGLPQPKMNLSPKGMRWVPANVSTKAVLSREEDPPLSIPDAEKEQTPFPLPAVAKILEPTTSNIAAEAELLHSSIVGQRRETEDALLERRKEYEQKLSDLADQNRKLNLANDVVRREVLGVKHANEVSARNIQQLHKGNELLRSAASVVEGKMSGASDFMKNLVSNTDNARLLKLIAEQALNLEDLLPKYRSSPSDMASFLADTRAFRGELALALLQKSEVRPVLDIDNVPNSGLIIQRLADSLNMLATAATEGEKTLNESFTQMADEAEQQRHLLLTQRAALNQTLVDEHRVKRGLADAQERVLSTRRYINERLHGLRVFLRRVDALVDETTQQAASLGAMDDFDLATTDKEEALAPKKDSSSDLPPKAGPLSKAVLEATKEAAAAKQAAAMKTAQEDVDRAFESLKRGPSRNKKIAGVKIHQNESRPFLAEMPLPAPGADTVEASSPSGSSTTSGSVASWFGFR